MPGAVSEQFANAMSGYGSGPLERDAITHATPRSELLREGSSMYTREAKPSAGMFLRGLLGR